MSRVEVVAASDSFHPYAGASVSTWTMFPLPAHQIQCADFPDWDLVRDHALAHGKLPHPTCGRSQPWRGQSRPSGKRTTFSDFTRCFPAQLPVQRPRRPPPVPPPPFLATGRGPLEFPNRNQKWLSAGTTVVGGVCPPLEYGALARCTTFQLCSNIPKWDESLAKKAHGWPSTLQRNLRSIEGKAASNSESSLA